MSHLLPKRGLKKQLQSEVRKTTDSSITDVAYRPATVEEVKKSIHKRKEALQAIHEEYKKAKKNLREAILTYRQTRDEVDKKLVIELTNEFSNDYFMSPLHNEHSLQYNPSKNDNSIQSIPTTGYLVRDLLFEHHRTTKIPEPVGILTYPQAYPAQWFFKQKVEAAASLTPAALGAAVGSESAAKQKGGAEGPKQTLSSRQIGAIIAARKARHF